MNANERRATASVGSAPERHAQRPAVRVRGLDNTADPAGIESPARRLEDVSAAAVAHIRRAPLTFLALTAVIGFAAGGALSFRPGRIALAAAARHLGRELLKQVL